MKLVFSITILLILCRCSSAQTFQWAKSVGSGANDGGTAVTADKYGNVYSTGYFFNTCDFDPGPGVYNLTSVGGSADIFISKLDSNGNFIWAIAFGEYSTEIGATINIDSAGNIVISGYFKGVVDFDPGPGVYNLASLANPGNTNVHDAFIIKLKPDGNLIWAKNTLATYSSESISLAIDRFGNIFITGSFDGYIDFDPGPAAFWGGSNGFNTFILKLDSNGDFIWATYIENGQSSVGTSVIVDSLGNIYSVGLFYGTADFDPGPATYNMVSGNGQDLYLLKLDKDGNFLWAKSVALLEQWAARNYSVAIDINHIFITGSFIGTVDFDPGLGVNNLATGPWSHNQFILKLDTSGNFNWAKSIGGYFSFCHAIKIKADALGNSYTLGYFKSTIDFDLGNNQYLLSSSSSPVSRCYFVLKLDSAGNFVWVEQFGDSNNAQGIGGFCSGFELDPSGNLFATGQYSDTSDFNPGIGTHNLISNGGLDIFVVKLNVCGQNYSNNYVDCDSVIINGIAYTNDTIFTHINNTVDGCDSNTVFNITINQTNSFITDSACSYYTLNGITYINSGTYTQTFLNANGCDSIITLNLTINPNKTVTVSANTLTSNAIGASYQWLSCTPFQKIIGETNQSFNPVTNGEYAVEITENGCVDTSICHTVMGLTTNDLSLNNAIQLFPNPVSKMLQVVSGLKVRKEIYNSMGQLLYTTKIAGYQDEIDVSHYSSGVYYIKVGTIAKKFIVE